MRMHPIVRLLCQALPKANELVVKSLKSGENLGPIQHTVFQYITPALAHLDARLNRVNNENDLKPDERSVHDITKHAVEATRQEWCMLTMDENLTNTMGGALQKLVEGVLEDNSRRLEVLFKLSRMNHERMTQQEDMALAKTYADVMNKLNGSMGQEGPSRIS